MLTDNQRAELTQAMVDFSKRVLQGKDCTLQETATLPSVLSLLLPGAEQKKG